VRMPARRRAQRRATIADTPRRPAYLLRACCAMLRRADAHRAGDAEDVSSSTMPVAPFVTRLPAAAAYHCTPGVLPCRACCQREARAVRARAMR